MSDWENFHSFLEALREGSFAKAARKTGLTYPTVRRRVEDLEHSLGVTLFVRAADGLSPTDAARRLQGEAEAMEGAAQSFLNIAAGEAGAATGMVRITCGELTAQEILPLVIRQLRARHPRLGLQVVIGPNAQSVLRGEADIAIQLSRPTQMALVGRRVGTAHVGLFAHRGYVAMAGAPKRAHDLKTFALIGTETDDHWKRIMAAHGLELKFGDFDFHTSSQTAQLAALRAGLGIGCLHAPIAARDPTLLRILADDVNQALEPWIITHEDLHHEPRIRVVIDALVEQMKTYIAGGLNA